MGRHRGVRKSLSKKTTAVSEVEERERIKENILKVFRARLKSPNQGGALLVGPDKTNKATRTRSENNTNKTTRQEKSTRNRPDKVPQEKNSQDSSKDASSSSSCSSMNGHGKRAHKTTTVRKLSKRKKKPLKIPSEKETAVSKHMKIAHAITYPHGRGGNSEGVGTITHSRVTQRVGLINTGKKSAPATRVVVPVHVSRQTDAEIRKLVQEVDTEFDTVGGTNVADRTTVESVRSIHSVYQHDGFPLELPLKEVVCELLHGFKSALKQIYPDRDYLKETQDKLLKELKENSPRTVTPTRLPVFNKITKSASIQRSLVESFDDNVGSGQLPTHNKRGEKSANKGYSFEQHIPTAPKINFSDYNPFQTLNIEEKLDTNEAHVPLHIFRGQAGSQEEKGQSQMDWLGGQGDSSSSQNFSLERRNNSGRKSRHSSGKHCGNEARLGENPGQLRDLDKALTDLFQGVCDSEETQIEAYHVNNKGLVGGQRNVKHLEDHRKKILGEITSYMKNRDHDYPKNWRSSLSDFLGRSDVGGRYDDKRYEGLVNLHENNNKTDERYTDKHGFENKDPIQYRMREKKYEKNMGYRSRRNENANDCYIENVFEGTETIGKSKEFFIMEDSSVNNNTQGGRSRSDRIMSNMRLEERSMSDRGIYNSIQDERSRSDRSMSKMMQEERSRSDRGMGNTRQEERSRSPVCGSRFKRQSPDSPIMSVEDLLRHNKMFASTTGRENLQHVTEHREGSRDHAGQMGRESIMGHVDKRPGHGENMTDGDGEPMEVDRSCREEAVELLQKNDRLIAIKEILPAIDTDIVDIQSKSNSQCSQCSRGSAGLNFDMIQTSQYMPSFHGNYYTDHMATGDLSWQQKQSTSKVEAMDLLDYIDQNSGVHLDCRGDHHNHSNKHRYHGDEHHREHLPVSQTFSPSTDKSMWLPADPVPGLRSLLPPPLKSPDSPKLYPRKMY